MNRVRGIVIALCACGIVTARAATNSWKGGSGSWDTANKWSLNSRPASDQDIVITNVGTFTVTLDDQAHASSMTVLSLALSNTTGASTLLITNRPSHHSPLTFRVLKDAVIDLGSTLMMIDKSSTTSGVAVITSNLFNNSALSLVTNASLVVSNVLHTATKLNQIGSLTTAGGNVTARSVKLGEAAGSLGTWTILDGTNLVGETLQIGSDNGTGTVNQLGGKLIVAGNASDYGFGIAGSPNSTGSVTLVNGQLAPGSLAIGERGTGRLIVSNGVLQSGSAVIGVNSGGHGVWQIVGGSNSVTYPKVGLGSGATGEVTVTGGNLSSTYMELAGSGFGSACVGSLTISNGVVNTGYLSLADGLNGAGTVTVAGGKLDVSPAPGGFNALVYLGNYGTGVLWQTGGEIYVTNFPDQFGGKIRLVSEVFGATDPYLAQLTCSGGVLRASEIDIGHPTNPEKGSSIWSIAGGTSFVERAVFVVSTLDDAGVLTISGGRLETPILNLGTSSGGGAVTISGGEVQVTQGLYVGEGTGAPSLLTVAGGNLKVANISFPGIEFPAYIGVGGAGAVNVASGSFTANTIEVGVRPGCVGTLTVSGGLVDAVGTSTFGTTLIVGQSSGSTGTVSYTGGNFHLWTITLGVAGFGNMFVSSNADFQPAVVKVANQSGAVGNLSLQGGMLFGTPLRQTYDLEIGVAAGSTGTVWVTDGALRAANPSGCFPGNTVSIGQQGSGRLTATNSTLILYNVSVGSAGTLECVNSQFFAQNAGCTVVNSNVMLFVNSTGTFSTPVQNSATIVADASTVTFSGPVNNSGWIVATNGALQFASSVTNSGAILFGPDQFHVTSVSADGNDVVITWQAFGGNRYRLQASTDLASGFGDISPEVATVGNGIMSTNCVDVGGLTNSPSRFYRVRQVW